MTATAVQQKRDNHAGKRRQRYYPEVMKGILEALKQGGEIKSNVYKRTRYGYHVTMEYLKRMEELGLVAREKNPTVTMCHACKRPISAVRKAQLTEKGLAYLRKLQEADEILEQ